MRGYQKNVIGLQSDFEVRLSIILVERRGAGIAGGIARAGFSEPGLRIKLIEARVTSRLVLRIWEAACLARELKLLRFERVIALNFSVLKVAEKSQPFCQSCFSIRT